MKFLVAIICPPLALLMCGKLVQFFISIPLTLCFYFPGLIHALFVVNSHEADLRNRKLIRAIQSSSRQMNESAPSQPSFAPILMEPSASRSKIPAVVTPIDLDEVPPDAAFESDTIDGDYDGFRVARFDFEKLRETAWRAICICRDGFVTCMQVASNFFLSCIRVVPNAYHSLPEWAQPILWGLGVVIPIAATMIAMKIFHGN